MIQNVDAYTGKRLRQRRTMMGLSQEAVAKEVGITFQQVQKYEKGINAMNARRLVEFAQFMNVPVAYFFDGIEFTTAENSGTSAGFSEGETIFDHGSPSDRESLEMMKAFKRIGAQPMRKRISDLVRAIADNKTLIDQ